ncbi:IQ domain-containing protein E isoform X1, partial [Sigmodon hispidus]
TKPEGKRSCTPALGTLGGAWHPTLGPFILVPYLCMSPTPWPLYTPISTKYKKMEVVLGLLPHHGNTQEDIERGPNSKMGSTGDVTVDRALGWHSYAKTMKWNKKGWNGSIMEATLTSEPGKKPCSCLCLPAVEKKLGVKRQKKMSSALLNLTRSVQELTEENQSLKEDLDRMLSNSPTVSKIKGYVDWSKPRLLRRIAELEKKVSSSESPKPSTSELVKPNPLVHSSSSISVQKQPKGDQSKEDQPKRDPPEDQEQLRDIVKILKVERSTLQAQLLEKDIEMDKLLQAKMDLEKELEMARKGEEERREQEQALREEIEALTNRCRELEEARQQERQSTVAVAHQLLHDPPLPVYSRQHAGLEIIPSSPEGPKRGTKSVCLSSGLMRSDESPSVLTFRLTVCAWRLREAVGPDAATVLQAAFRGHLARSKLLRSRAPDCRSPSLTGLPSQPQSSPTPRVPRSTSPPAASPAQEEAIIAIQSILRGYLAQARFIANCCRGMASVSSQRDAVSATPSECASSPPSLAASPGNFIHLAWERRGQAELGVVDSSQDPPSGSAADARPQPMSPAPVDDVFSDDSDDIIFSPFLPRKKSPSPF